MAQHSAVDDGPSPIPWAVAAIVVSILVGVLVYALVLHPLIVHNEDRPLASAEEPAPAEEEAAPPTTPFNSLLATGEITSIRLVGDSITAGFGTTDYVDADASGEGAVIYDDGEGTVHRETSAAAQCWANSFRAWAGEHGIGNFVNAGINGAFMKQLAATPAAWLQGGADVVVVALGTNDAGYYGTDEFREDARMALASCAGLSRLVVVVTPPADLRDPSTLVEPASALGDVLAELCAEGGYLLCDTRAAVTPDLFWDDGLHPNTQGSDAIWQALRQTLGI